MTARERAPEPSPAEPLLRARGVCKRFGGITAVDDVDLDIGRGEVVGLIGPNGSGKSTLLACLSRDQTCDAGEVTFEGRPLGGLKAHRVARRGISRTFQDLRVFSELTVAENAMLARDWTRLSPLALLARPDADTRERVAELLELTEMTRLARTVAGSLSGGQRRLLELVMALVSRPRLVLLDEAASGINPTLVERLRAYVLRMRENEEVAFLVVEHNVDFIFSLADRIVVMETGSVLAQGTPAEIREDQGVIDAYLGA